jgi:hypothetical protein
LKIDLSRKPTRSRFLAPVVAGVAGVVDPIDMDAERIPGAAMITRGPALGHGMWVDGEFLDQVTAATNAGRPIKSRWTHPGLSSDGLGKLVGHCRDAYRDGDVVRCELHVADLAHRSPDGDLGAYVLEQARMHPADFGLSIVFEHDVDAEIAFHLAHGAEWREDEYIGRYLSLENFVSPDPDNVDHLPHCRMLKLKACDFVGDPAANPAGLFHDPTADVPAAADAFVSYAFGLTDDQPPAPFQGIDPDRARAFALRFLERKGVKMFRHHYERTRRTMPQGTPKKGLLARVFGAGKPTTQPAKAGSKTTPAKPSTLGKQTPPAVSTKASTFGKTAAGRKLAEGDDDEEKPTEAEEGDDDDAEPVPADDRPADAEPAEGEEEKPEEAAGVTCPACEHVFDPETGEPLEADEEKPSEAAEGDDEKPTSEDLAAYLDTFGAVRGAQLFAKGYGMKRAAAFEVKRLRKQLGEARAEVKRLQSLAASAAEGETEGVSFGAPANAASKLQNVPTNVARFAAACTPKAK